MKPFPIIAASSFLVAAIVGWQVAGASFQHQRHESALVQAVKGKLSQREVRSMSRYRTPAEVREMMKAIRAAGSPAEQMRATMALAESIPVSEIEKWLEGRWFDDREGFNLTLLNRLLNERWMKEDPDGFFAYQMKQGGQGNEMLVMWSKDAPDKILAYFKNHPDAKAELNALSVMAKSHPDLALGRLGEMMTKGQINIFSTEAYDAKQIMLDLMRKNPAALDTLLGTLPEKWNNMAEALSISVRLKASFETEIQKLYEREDGWKMLMAGPRGTSVNSKLIMDLANMPDSWKKQLASNYVRFMNSSTAAQWLAADLEGNGFKESDAKNIRSMALEEMSYNKPEEALKMLQTCQISDESRRQLILNIINRYRSQKEKVQSLMSQLSSEEDRKVAETALGKISNAPVAVKNPENIEKPSEWLEAVASFKSGEEISYEYVSQLRNWDSAKIAEFSHEFQTMPEDQKRNAAMVIALGLHSDTPGNALLSDAISYLVSNSADNNQDQANENRGNPVNMASIYAFQWAQKDPVAASNWVNSLPSGEAKLWAQKNVANNWSQYDPDAANQWIATLPAKERAEVESFVKKGGKR
jgi:hypothetical protein